MIPILFDKDEVSFATNGLGRLRDCISCVVTEERNGIYECDFEYPIDGAHYELIQIGRIICVTHEDSNDIQPFDIVSYTKPIDGIVSFHAVHISYRQSYMVVTGRNINSLADAFTLFSNALPQPNPFIYKTNKTSTGYLGSADGVTKTVRSMLGGIEGSVLDAYGGEYEWDRWTVNLWTARGQLRDFTIRYGVNMLDYNEELDSTSCYSSCVPYWTDGTTTVVGDKQVSGSITPSGREQIIPLDVSEKFEEEPTKAQVESMGLAVMNGQNPAIPSQTITVSFARLQDIGYNEYDELLQCKLCDSINVIFPDYKTSATFKIVKTVWNVLADEYDEMELGDLSVSLSEALGINQESSTKLTTPTPYDCMDLIWTNSAGADSMTATMGAGNVTVTKSTSLYKGLVVEFRCFYNSGERTYGIDMFGATGMFARETTTRATGNPIIAYTRIWYPSDEYQITFSDCTRISSNAANVTGSDTGCLVPLRIWGIPA